ncbi:ATP-binding protein [Sphingomonas sp. C3-2]|uniref:ATP-binding protein n=1 Tax=Sphingomonas sp. C3-2 TaxID=3062169 RepID=UPI00294AA9C6|nr:ATP-binding protein [Sphingomonas sp. C3-2]WOK35316.1 ATP-binding protein [Sphingomonas sp. C3-2]
MRLTLRPSVGLFGGFFAILLLALIIEVAVSTLLHERDSQLRVHTEELHRVADQLAIATRLMNGEPEDEREDLAASLSSAPLEVRWQDDAVPPLPHNPALDETRAQMLLRQPSLAKNDLCLDLAKPEREGVINGQLRLNDGSQLEFRTTQLVTHPKFHFSGFLRSLIPAVVLILIGGVLAGRMLSPMRMLADAAVRIGNGERVHVPETGVPEIRRVVRAFNVMQERIHQAINDRTEALASVGHDLRTPLARLQLRTELIADQSVRAPIEKDVNEMEAMVASLMAYFGGDSDPERPVQADVAVLAQTLVDDMCDMGENASYRGPDHLEVTVRTLALKRALSNLIENAIKYADGAHVSVEQSPGYVSLCVEDNGPGIPESELEHVLEPFVRLDPARSRDTHGLGLGIPIAHRMAKREGGRLILSNRSNGGLRAEIRLPHR